MNLDPQTFIQNPIKSQARANYLRCDNEWINDLDPSTNFISYAWDDSSAVDDIVGVAINGVPIRQSFSDDGYDPINPRAFGVNVDPVAVPIDDCLGYWNDE